jgi:hypothetical protein
LREEPREGKAIFDGNTIRPIEVSFSAVRRRAAVLDEMFSDDLYAFGPHRDLLGSRATGERVAVTFDEELYRDVDANARTIPAFFRARVRGDVPAGRPLAVIANGRVAGVGQTYVEDDATRIAVMLSPRYLEDGRNAIEVRWIE